MNALNRRALFGAAAAAATVWASPRPALAQAAPPGRPVHPRAPALCLRQERGGDRRPHDGDPLALPPWRPGERAERRGARPFGDRGDAARPHPDEPEPGAGERADGRAQQWRRQRQPHHVLGDHGRPGGDPTGELAAAIAQDFGDLATFKTRFAAASNGVFGSGWAFVTVTPAGRLAIVTKPGQDNPLMDGSRVLMGNDVWEHAYYLRYQNRRAEYTAAWWNVLDWSKIGRYRRRRPARSACEPVRHPAGGPDAAGPLQLATMFSARAIPTQWSRNPPRSLELLAHQRRLPRRRTSSSSRAAISGRASDAGDGGRDPLPHRRRQPPRRAEPDPLRHASRARSRAPPPSARPGTPARAARWRPPARAATRPSTAPPAW